MGKLIYGVGVSEDGEFKRSYRDENGKKKDTKEYKLWYDMLTRCYSPKYHARFPSYIGCEVSENFKNFQFFAGWCNNQIGFNEVGYQLEKDIIITDNIIYSENACAFVPKSLNILLTKGGNKTYNLPNGVFIDKRSGQFIANISILGRTHRVGSFATVQQAHETYKMFKEAYVKSRTLIWKDKIDPRVFDALMKYKVI